MTHKMDTDRALFYDCIIGEEIPVELMLMRSLLRKKQAEQAADGDVEWQADDPDRWIESDVGLDPDDSALQTEMVTDLMTGEKISIAEALQQADQRLKEIDQDTTVDNIRDARRPESSKDESLSQEDLDHAMELIADHFPEAEDVLRRQGYSMAQIANHLLAGAVSYAKLQSVYEVSSDMLESTIKNAESWENIANFLHEALVVAREDEPGLNKSQFQELLEDHDLQNGRVRPGSREDDAQNIQPGVLAHDATIQEAQQFTGISREISSSAGTKEVDPVVQAVSDVIVGNREAIQDDLGDIEVEEIENVLLNVGMTSIETYKQYIKLVLFAGASEREQDLAYEVLIEDRIKHLFQNANKQSEEEP